MRTLIATLQPSCPSECSWWTDWVTPIFGVALVLIIVIGALITDRGRRRRIAARFKAGNPIPGDLASIRAHSLLTVLEDLRAKRFTGAVDITSRQAHRRIYLREGQAVSTAGPEIDDEARIIAAFAAARGGAAISVLARAKVPDGGRIRSSLLALEDRSHRT